MPEFLLTREPWLPVITPQGTDTVGLLEVFTRAEDTMIAPGGPLEERAVNRLLLAITYAAVGAPTAAEYPRPLPGERIARWLREHEASFDLIHPRHPFAQDAALAEAHDYARVVPLANLDSTIARSRPLLTDHRRGTEMTPVPLAQTVVPLLVYNLFDAPGIHEGVRSPSAPQKNGSLKGTEGSTLTFGFKGTLAQTLTWAAVPVDTVGAPQWSYTGSGSAEVDPAGEAEALTLLYRRMLLTHDGHHATGAQVHQGQVRKRASTPGPPDTQPGQRNVVLSAVTANTSAATSDIGAATTAGRGNPLNLIQRWEAASEGSLSGWVRHALAQDPTLTPPTVIAHGQRLENTALKVLAREAPVPRVEGGLTAATERLQDARYQARLFPSDDHRLLGRLTTPDPEELDLNVEDLRVTTPTNPETPTWPRHAQRLSGTPADDPAPLDLPGLSPETLRALGAVVEIEDRKDPAQDTPTLLRRVRYALFITPEATEHLARVTTTRTPTPEDLAPLNLPALTEAHRLWAGLLATAAYTHRFPWDGEKPLPAALRQAGARTSFPHTADTLRAATNAPDIHALRTPLTQALQHLAQARTPFSWWSLAEDLHHWNHSTREAWNTAFHTPTTKDTH